MAQCPYISFCLISSTYIFFLLTMLFWLPTDASNNTSSTLLALTTALSQIF